jgi:phosphohistidine phosphatase SixA
MRLTIKSIVIAVAMFIACTGSAAAQDNQLLGSARTALVKSDVVFNKDRKYESQAIPFSLIYRSGLLKTFREVASNPDIIIMFHKDVFIIGNETVSLTVFDAETNNVIFSEERKLVDEENDVNRLVAHLVAKVRTERDAILTERELKAQKTAKVVLKIYSPSAPLLQAIVEANRSLGNQFEVFLLAVTDLDDADVVLVEQSAKGSRVLVLTSGNPKEVFHTEAISEQSNKRAVALMSKWIAAKSWQ